MTMIFKSIVVAALVSIFFLIFAVSAMFLVGGDGSAPAFTYFMLKLIDVPRQMFGISSEGMLLPASLFWGSIAGFSTLVIHFLKIVLGGPQIPVDKENSAEPK
jgi:hypothetical protein